jgi:hypothetical protein
VVERGGEQRARLGKEGQRLVGAAQVGQHVAQRFLQLLALLHLGL